MRKSKHKAPGAGKKTGPRFIKFTPVQSNYLNEVRIRGFREFNDALETVYEEIGIIEQVRDAPPGTYTLRGKDLSGVVFNPEPLPPAAEKEPDLEGKGKKPE